MKSAPAHHEQRLLYKKIGESENEICFFPPFQSADQKAPVLFLIPGGGWQRNTADSMYNMARITADRLRNKGFAVASISYRGQLADHVHMPEITADVFDAMGYLSRYQDALQIDPQRIYVMGHSAGAHLALLTSYMPKEQVSAYCEYANEEHFTVKAVAAIAPPVMLQKENSRLYMEPDPLPLFEYQTQNEYKTFSPITYVTEQTAPTFLATGTKDTLVAPIQADLLYQALKEKGVFAKLVISENGDHCLLSSDSDVMAVPDLPVVLQQIADFFETCEQYNSPQFNAKS